MTQEANATRIQPAKTPKTGTKLKLTTPKTPTGETGKKAAGSRAKQTASSKKGKAAANEDSDESSPPAKEPEPKVNVEEAKKKREKEGMFNSQRYRVKAYSAFFKFCSSAIAFRRASSPVITLLRRRKCPRWPVYSAN
jgi:hypothetical protein